MDFMNWEYGRLWASGKKVKLNHLWSWGIGEKEVRNPLKYIVVTYIHS